MGCFRKLKGLLVDSNPYQTPQSSLDSKPGKPNNTIWWKIFFGISAFFILLTVIMLPFMASTYMDYVDMIVSTIGVVGLFGFAFYKPIVNVVIWRYFFYIALVESIIYSGALVFMGIKRYGEPPSFDAIYAFEIVYVALYLAALYLYAYRRNYIWK
jgi:hypothetical protein